MPTPEVGIRGVILSDGTIMPDTEDDELWFVGGDGIILTHEQNTAAGNCNSSVENFPTIRIDAVGDPLFLRKLCDPVNAFTTPNFIKTLQNKHKELETISKFISLLDLNYTKAYLAKKYNSKIVFGPNANPKYDVLVVKDNDELILGKIKFKILHLVISF